MYHNNDILFYDKEHKYINIKLNEKLISVTTALKLFQEEYNTEYWSNKKADDYKTTQEVVLDNWELKKTIGLWLGSLTHSYIENRMHNKIIDLDIPNNLFNSLTTAQVIKLDEWKNNLINQANDFIKDFNHYNYLGSEIIVGNHILGGQIDYLTKECIIDFKSDRQLDFSNHFQNMTNELSYLQDCNYNKYMLQVSLYRYLYQEQTQHKFEQKDKIIKFDRYSTTYIVHEIPYLSKEVDIIISKLSN